MFTSSMCFNVQCHSDKVRYEHRGISIKMNDIDEKFQLVCKILCHSYHLLFYWKDIHKSKLDKVCYPL